MVNEAEKPCLLRLAQTRATRGWPTTHECSWIVIMPQANGISQLVRNVIAHELGQREGREAVGAPDKE